MRKSKESGSPSLKQLPPLKSSASRSLTQNFSDQPLKYLQGSHFFDPFQSIDSSVLSRLDTPAPYTELSGCSFCNRDFHNELLVGDNNISVALSTSSRNKKVLTYEAGKKFYPHPRREPLHVSPYECFLQHKGALISQQFLLPPPSIQSSVVTQLMVHNFHTIESPKLPLIASPVK